MASNNDVSDKQLKEYYRSVDHQIDTIRHYENLSWQLIRTYVGIFGILITGALVSVRISDSITPIIIEYIYGIDLQSLAEGIAGVSRFLSEESGTLIVALTLMALPILFAISLYYVIVSAFQNAYLIQFPETAACSSVRPDENPTKTTVSESQIIVEEYNEILRDNQEIVEEVQGYWKESLDSIRRGLSLMVFVLALSLPILWGMPQVALMMFTGLLIMIGIIIIDNLEKEQVIYVSVTDAFNDSALISVGIFLYGIQNAPIDNDIINFLLLLVGFFALIGPVGTARKNFDFQERIFYRNIIITAFLFIVTVILHTALEFTGTYDYPLGVGIITLLVIMAFINTISLTVVTAVRVCYRIITSINYSEVLKEIKKELENRYNKNK